MPAAEAKCARCVMKANLGEIVRERRGEEKTSFWIVPGSSDSSMIPVSCFRGGFSVGRMDFCNRPFAQS